MDATIKMKCGGCGGEGSFPNLRKLLAFWERIHAPCLRPRIQITAAEPSDQEWCDRCVVDAHPLVWHHTYRPEHRKGCPRAPVKPITQKYNSRGEPPTCFQEFEESCAVVEVIDAYKLVCPQDGTAFLYPGGDNLGGRNAAKAHWYDEHDGSAVEQAALRRNLLREEPAAAEPEGRTVKPCTTRKNHKGEVVPGQPLCPGCIAIEAICGARPPHNSSCQRILEPLTREESLESLSSPGRTPDGVD